MLGVGKVRGWGRIFSFKQGGGGTERDKKGKMLLFNKVGKGCILDKGRNVVTEVIKNSYTGSFITEVYFFIFLITSKHFMKFSGVKCILSVILFQSLIDLT